MATEKQAAYFVSIYDKESDRTKSLRDIAKVYIGLTSLYSAFIIFVTDKTKPGNILELGLYIACITAFLVAFYFSLQVLQVAAYERPSDPYKIIQGFDKSPPKDEDFFDHRIIDLTVASGRNALVNDKKAVYLSLSGYLILSGLAGHAAYFIAWVAGRANL